MKTNTKSVCKEKNFQLIFERHSESVRNFVYYKCGSIEKAEDIVQDAFMKLWQNCKKVSFQKAKSYVLKIAQNQFYNSVVHEKVVLKYRKQLQASPFFIENPEFLLEEKQFFEKLERSIQDLPTEQREVFLLSRKDKKTYREIAEIIGITPKVVERRMHLALLGLRKKIGKII